MADASQRGQRPRNTRKASCTCPAKHQADLCKHCQIQQRFDRPRRRKLLLPKPTIRLISGSEDHILAKQLIQHIPQLAPHSTWLRHLPAHLGHCSVVDTATLALIQSVNFHFAGSVDEGLRQESFLHYGKALTMLRDLVSSSKAHKSDYTMMTIGMIALFELIMRDHANNGRQGRVYAHWGAMNSIFRARPTASETSEFMRAILSIFGVVPFCLPVAKGAPSELERESETTSNSDFSETAKLIKIASILRNKRPRLISYIRWLSTAQRKTEAAVSSVKLAIQLYELMDGIAESSLLHRLKVVETKDPNSKAITPYSFQFQSSDDLVAAVMYWLNTCATINLCLRLGEIHPPSKEAFDTPRLRAEKERHAMNLIMCWEQASAIGPFCSLQVAKGFVQIWRDLRFTTRFRDIDSAELKAWLLPKIKHPFMEWLPPNSGEQHIDVASEMVVGGSVDDFLRLSSVGDVEHYQYGAEVQEKSRK